MEANQIWRPNSHENFNCLADSFEKGEAMKCPDTLGDDPLSLIIQYINDQGMSGLFRAGPRQ